MLPRTPPTSFFENLFSQLWGGIFWLPDNSSMISHKTPGGGGIKGVEYCPLDTQILDEDLWFSIYQRGKYHHLVWKHWGNLLRRYL